MCSAGESGLGSAGYADAGGGLAGVKQLVRNGTMGVVPSGSALKGVPTFNTNTGEIKGAGTDKGSEEDSTEDKNDREENPTTIAQQASTLISLVSAQSPHQRPHGYGLEMA